jgi:hypothetical protein
MDWLLSKRIRPVLHKRINRMKRSWLETGQVSAGRRTSVGAQVIEFSMSYARGAWLLRGMCLSFAFFAVAKACGF